MGLYYFNFETGDSMWEHPNDQHYRQKVARERDRIKNKHKTPKVIIFDLSMSVIQIGPRVPEIVRSTPKMNAI